VKRATTSRTHASVSQAAFAVGAIIAAGAFLLAAAPRAHAFPWSIDMFRGPEVQPLASAPRVTPSDTLPVHGGEPPMSREQAAATLHNPLTPTAARLEHGKALFLNNCAPCHGAGGSGNGSVAHLLSRPPTDLVNGLSKDQPDGYIYGTIRNGGVVMPSYDDAMSIDERWQVVMFVRSLQQAAKVAGQ
jgi:mono/diheme cytochrome c family protein